MLVRVQIEFVRFMFYVFFFLFIIIIRCIKWKKGSCFVIRLDLGLLQELELMPVSSPCVYRVQFSNDKNIWRTLTHSVYSILSFFLSSSILWCCTVACVCACDRNVARWLYIMGNLSKCISITLSLRIIIIRWISLKPTYSCWILFHFVI